MLKFSIRLPTLRHNLTTLSHFQFVKHLSEVKNTLADNQMDGECNSSMEVDTPRQDTVEGSSSPAASDTSKGSDGESDSQCQWRCLPIEAVHRGILPFELDHLGPVQPSAHHKVLYRYPIREPITQPPRPFRGVPRWDGDHVRLPCAPESKYPIEGDDGSTEIESRWGMVERALLRPITNSKQLQAAILSYNSTYKGHWSFRSLHNFFNEELDESESRVFFEDLLPRIIRLALRLPELIQAPIPLLRQNHTAALSLTQEQISCLLANAFLCTYPRRNTLKRKSEYSNFPDINFNRLYQSTGAAVFEKLKCIFHYFRRVCPTERDASNVPTGCLTFMRVSATKDDEVDWSTNDATLSSVPMHITAGGTIEDQGIGLLQVDFANKFLGGGVLSYGCVQEEIRFVICPELLVSKLFTECLLPTEALLMIGSERYSNYTGYASTFVWAGNHEECTPYDKSRRRHTAIVAIDALSFGRQMQSHQYSEDLILRELNKASIGFKHWLTTPAPGVATGNWGCGAFGGDPHLKALIQMMVCAHHCRPLAYFTFGNRKLRDDLHILWQLFRAHGTTVRQLYNVLRRYKTEGDANTLFEFVQEQLKHLHKQPAADVSVAPMTASAPALATAAGSSPATAKKKPSVSAPATATSSPSASMRTPAADLQSPDLFADSDCSQNNGIVISDSYVRDDDDDVNDVDEDNENEDEDDNDNDNDNDFADAEEEQANAMMLAASLDSSSSNNAAPAEATAPPASVPSKRQQTLLEMLDRHYEQGQANGSKRQHLSAGAEKSVKARKDGPADDASGGNSCRH